MQEPAAFFSSFCGSPELPAIVLNKRVLIIAWFYYYLLSVFAKTSNVEYIGVASIGPRTHIATVFVDLKLCWETKLHATSLKSHS